MYPQVYHAQDATDHHGYWLRNDPNRFHDRIDTPYVALNAYDDPICIGRLIPYDKFAVSTHAINVTTQCGGHCGWYDAFHPRSWAVDAIVTIANCMLQMPAGKAELAELTG